MKVELKQRTSDNWGCGAYGASRGNGRTHKGIDYQCPVGSRICAIRSGTVTRIGYPYDDDLDHDGRPDYTYVQVTDRAGNDWRYFYVEPCVEIGAKIRMGDVLGDTQCLGNRYAGITEHCHLEIKKSGKFLDVRKFV